MSGPWVRPLRSAPRFVPDAEALAALVPDGSRVSIGGFHFSRQPIRLVEALAARRVRGLTHVNWGGSIGLEILLEADAIEHLVFCFSSLELYGTAPNFRRALESGHVTHEEYTALELHHALLAAQMNLPTLPLQAPAGSWRAAPGGELLVEAPDIEVDVILLHAQRADRTGNVEISSAQGLDRTLALAGRRVLVTVEEIVEPGAFGDRAAFIPRQFVEAIAVVPGGAWPTSCLPFYGPDFAELGRRVAAGGFSSDAHEGPGRIPRAAASVDWKAAAWPVPSTEGDPTAELMVAWLARRLDDHSVCSVGSASSLATVAYLAAKAGHAPGLALVTHNGGYVDVASRFASLTFGEAADHQSAAGICGGDESYRWFYQQSRVTDEVVGAGQIDARARTNNGWIPLPDGRRLRLPGQGGMADVANMHRNFLLYSPRQSSRQLVEEVAWVSASRGLLEPGQRETMGYGPGEVLLLTDLAVFRLGPEGRLRLESLHPGVTLEAVSSRTGFAIDADPEVPQTPAPSDEELSVIRRVDPFRLRELESVPARERLEAIASVVDREAAYLGEVA
jgi:glutaconate CoA-transferase, subunit A